jgi:hypothetical protein
MLYQQALTKLNHKSSICKYVDDESDVESDDEFEDEIYNWKIKTNLALNDIMHEFNNQNIININKPLLYFIRIWNRYEDVYVYKIGYAANLYDRLGQINIKYESFGRIYIIACANIDNDIIEKNIHKIMRHKYGNYKIGNPIKSSPRELYEISLDFYYDFMNLLDNMGLNYFESNNYIYDIVDETEYIYNKNGHIYLDQNANENSFWEKKLQAYI